MMTNNDDKITTNTQDIIALKKDVDYISDNMANKRDLQNLENIVVNLRDNHLLHISQDIKDLQSEVQSLRNYDASQRPDSDRFSKIIDYIVMAIVIAAVSYFMKGL